MRDLKLNDWARMAYSSVAKSLSGLAGSVRRDLQDVAATFAENARRIFQIPSLPAAFFSAGETKANAEAITLASTEGVTLPLAGSVVGPIPTPIGVGPVYRDAEALIRASPAVATAIE